MGGSKRPSLQSSFQILPNRISKAAELAAALRHRGRDAAHERLRGADLLGARGERVQIDAKSRKANRVYDDHAVVSRRDGSGDARVHGRRQHASELMIGMVAGQFRAAGREKLLFHLFVSFTIVFMCYV